MCYLCKQPVKVLPLFSIILNLHAVFSYPRIRILVPIFLHLDLDPGGGGHPEMQVKKMYLKSFVNTIFSNITFKKNTSNIRFNLLLNNNEYR